MSCDGRCALTWRGGAECCLRHAMWCAELVLPCAAEHEVTCRRISVYARAGLGCRRGRRHRADAWRVVTTELAKAAACVFVEWVVGWVSESGLVRAGASRPERERRQGHASAALGRHADGTWSTLLPRLIKEAAKPAPLATRHILPLATIMCMHNSACARESGHGTAAHHGFQLPSCRCRAHVD